MENTEPNPHKELTAWAKDKLRPRWFFKSKFFVETKEGKLWKSATYRRPRLEGEIRGKLNIKAAKRARVRLMKEAQKA